MQNVKATDIAFYANNNNKFIIMLRKKGWGKVVVESMQYTCIFISNSTYVRQLVTANFGIFLKIIFKADLILLINFIDKYASKIDAFYSDTYSYL